MDFRFIIKVLLTAVLVAAISEIGKRSSIVGAIIASLPLTSLLAFIWLYIDKHENEPVALLSMDIFWMVIPSLAFFPLFSYLLRQQMSFALAMGISVGATAGIYYLFFMALRYFKVLG